MTLARMTSALALVAVVAVVVVLARSAAPPHDVGAPTDAASVDNGRPAPDTVSQSTGDLPDAVPDHARPATVASITDGDTLRVDTGEANEPVRLLEIDTPEVTGDCGAGEATDALTTLAPVGSRLWMEADVEDRDRYGRLLRYLWNDDGTMINETLVRQGWARATLYRPNDRYWPAMQRAERKAHERNAGLWNQCDWAATQHPPSLPSPSRPTAATSCDPNYSGCVPVHPPDVDCNQIDGPVTVLGADPHHLDGNGDGHAC